MDFNFSNIDMSNGINPPRPSELFAHYLTNTVFINYHNEKRFKRDRKYKPFTTVKGLLKQLKYSESVTYLYELMLNDCIVWELREHKCSPEDIEFLKNHERNNRKN